MKRHTVDLELTFGCEKKVFAGKQKGDLGFNFRPCNTDRVGYVRCILGRITFRCVTGY
jgi:hypothetical protein